MYNPARFKSLDNNEALDLIAENPFATLISVADGKPLVSHLPLVCKMLGGEIYLIGHLARANPHCKILSATEVTAIFHGPHTYITPKWYVENDAPTWNYSVVHATGSVTLIENTEGIIECLKELSAHTEKLWPSDWDFFMPPDLDGDALKKHISGFKIKVTDINYKKKFSQNKNSTDRAGVILGLKNRTDEGSKKVLAEMLKIYADNGEIK